MKTSLTQEGLFTILPNNFAWLVGVTALMFVTPAGRKKWLINLLVAKVLFEAYTIVVKHVQEPDLIDLLAPHLTLFHRRFLADYLFAAVFTLLGQYLVSEGQAETLEADLQLFAHKAVQGGVPKSSIEEVEAIAKTIGIRQSKKED
jgi:hypothetical protein